jgi:hypothetical protein
MTRGVCVCGVVFECGAIGCCRECVGVCVVVCARIRCGVWWVFIYTRVVYLQAFVVVQYVCQDVDIVQSNVVPAPYILASAVGVSNTVHETLLRKG